MMTSKVTFEQEGQKIIIDFILDENTGSLEYKPTFEPPVDPKTNLGLSGQLCEAFIAALHNNSTDDADAEQLTDRESID